ncbi:MAG: stage 0 sporulation family protein [Desulfuromonadales bacterium]|nr:stage 0 sporulation family protein [Desulfuromonadales bacterium]
MSRIISIQFSTASKLYDFNAGEMEISAGDRVVVETERGLSVGQVMRGPVEREVAADEKIVTIKRKATSDDLATLERNTHKEQEAFDFCLRRIVERNMQMKLVRVEYQFDGSKAVFFFTADGRVDFRDLVKDLAHTFHTRIEMRQIGVRDESKITGGLGICGRELCCSSWLRDFQPVSVKMAKEQNLALNPNKISGQCGRLLCCLDYEYETYCSLRKTFPKCGKRVRTASANGVIDKLNILTGTITLRMDDGKQIVVRREEVLGDASVEETPVATAVKPAVRQEQQRERQRPQRPAPRNPVKKVESIEALAAKTEAPPKEQKVPEEGAQPKPGKRKNRNRRHGHRKPGEAAAPAAGAPGSDPKRSEP